MTGEGKPTLTRRVWAARKTACAARDIGRWIVWYHLGALGRMASGKAEGFRQLDTSKP